MIAKDIHFQAPDGTELLGYEWLPESQTAIRGIVQICHGMGETASRYERFAKKLCESGYAVYAHDQRGHGRTAGSPEKVGFIADTDSFGLLVADLHQLNERIHAEFPDFPVFLFGHSMGSFVSQGFIQLYGNDIHGLVLSGTNGRQGFLLDAGKLIAQLEIRSKGRNVRSPMLNQLSFGTYNNAFKPTRTEFDWLSRDNSEVDAYINNPFCGGVFSTGFFLDFVVFLKNIQKSENLMKIPVKLPVFLVSGDKDPVGNAGKGVLLLKQTYEKLGMKDISLKLYAGARHEILNETNREEVMQDVLVWINAHSGGL